MKQFNRFILILSIITLLYTIFINIYGNIAFSKILGLIAIIGIIYASIQIKMNDQLFEIFPTWMKYTIYGLFYISLAVFILVEGVIIHGGVQRDHLQVDKVIVLGAGIKGETISSSLQYRLDACLDYYEQFKEATIIVSGGQGEGESITEALAMERYLVSHGIPKDKIIQEDQSTNTYENFEFSKKYIEENEKVMVISNNFHMSRAKLIASRLDLEVYGYSAKTHGPTMINFYIREFFAYMKDFVLG